MRWTPASLLDLDWTCPCCAAHGDEARYIDVATVASYRRVVMCQEARR